MNYNARNLRTYQRKKRPVVNCMPSLPALPAAETCNDSLNYDLFETTFDRIAKGAVVPPMPLENRNDSWKGSSSDSDINDKTNVKSPEHVASNYVRHSSTFDSIQVSHKLAHKHRKRKGWKPEITKQATKQEQVLISSGILSKRTRVVTRKGKTQSKKVQGQKTQTSKIQRKKALKKSKSNSMCNEQISNTNSNVIDNLKDASYKNDFKHMENSDLYQQVTKSCSVKLNTHTVQNYMLNREKIEENKQDIPIDAKLLQTDTFQTNTNISQIPNTISQLISFNFGNCNTSVKQRPIAIDDNIVKDWYVSNSKKNMEDTIDIRDKSNVSHLIFDNAFKVTPKCSEGRELAPNNAKKNSNLMKDCFVNMERLKIGEFIKENRAGSSKKEQNIVSSTPIGTRVKPSTCSVTFSPIDSNNIVDKSHLSQKYLLAKEVSNVDRKDCSSIQKAQTLVLSRKSRLSMDSAVKNEVITCENDIHVALTQEIETGISHSLNMYVTSQSRSLFGDTTYNHLTKGTDEDNVEKKDSSNKLVKTDLDSSTDLRLKREQLSNYNAQADTRKSQISGESLKSKLPEKYSTERNIVEASHENKDEPVNINKHNLLGESRGNVNNVNACEMLTRLQDSIRIGRRTRYSKWHLNMSNVFNNEAMRRNNEILRTVAIDEDVSTVRLTCNSEHSKNAIKSSFDNLESFIDTTRLHNDTNGQMEKSVFLKPGKGWARSLSILNHVNDGADLDKLSVGKGKKWRHSVINVLHMQKQGIFQSCLKESKDDTDLSRLSASNGSSFNGNKCKEVNLANYARFSKRISVRVVPNSISSKCDIKDIPFLEAFGITAEKSPSLKLSNQEESLIHDDLIGSHSTTARDVVLQRCSQKCYMSFAECFPDSYLEHCHKIGEGVYGEVFIHECDGMKSVIKIIPIENDQLVNGEPQKKFSEILSEIVIAKELDNLRLNAVHRTDGFVEVKNVSCIIGKYPAKLIELWNMYDNEKTSDNDCPSMFDENQLYIVLELGHGGQDLEAFVFQTAEEACALFLQITLALAVAEKAFEFEHRDLHWGNVLISRTKEPYVYYNLDEREIKLPTKNVKVSIIDFTLSRMLYQGCCIYNDLALDPALFTAHGEYQFEIYRLMRDKIQNNWRKFEPYTNVLWLHYILDKMIMAVRYKRKNLKVHKQAIVRLKEFKDTMLNYDSAYDFIINSNSIVYL